MTKQAKLTIEEKVTARLVKWGWNPETALNLVNGPNFAYCVKHYRTPAKIAEVLTSLD